MATGYISLFPGGYAPSGASGHESAALSYAQSAGTPPTNAPDVFEVKLLFDGTTDEHWLFSFIMPGDYASGGTLRGVAKATSGTSVNAIMKAAYYGCVDDSTDDDAGIFDTVAVSTAVAMDATQGQTTSFTIALTMTNAAANRRSVIMIGRDPNNASDNFTTDLELMNLNFEYVA